MLGGRLADRAIGFAKVVHELSQAQAPRRRIFQRTAGVRRLAMARIAVQ